jgi:3-deoxy-manno-octulosonate cytidylyltransferase (CMP-KDO synthetase)
MGQAFTVILAIPARLDSSRLPRKLVAEIGGKPMLGHVLERCLQATSAHATVLCTDSQELADQAAGLGVSSLLTSADCTSGSDRIASVADQLLAAANSAPERTIIINVQGDQPFLDPALIDAIAASFIARQPTPEVLTPIYRLTAEKLHNPNVVKVLLAADGRGLYFSRWPCPTCAMWIRRNGVPTPASGGMWASTPTALMCCCAGPSCPSRPWSSWRSSNSCG